VPCALSLHQDYYFDVESLEEGPQDKAVFTFDAAACADPCVPDSSAAGETRRSPFATRGD